MLSHRPGMTSMGSRVHAWCMLRVVVSCSPDGAKRNPGFFWQSSRIALRSIRATRKLPDYDKRAPLHHSRLFLLRLLDQFLAHHHVAAGDQENHGRGAGDRQDDDGGIERDRAGKMAAEPGAELREQRADAHLQETHRAGGGAGGHFASPVALNAAIVILSIACASTMIF